MKQIRNLAISGVDTLEKASMVCEIVGDGVEDELTFGLFWFFDDGSNYGVFMGDWVGQEDHTNFKNCTQMTYEEFLKKYDNESESIDVNPDDVSADKREMETDSESTNKEATIITPDSVNKQLKELDAISELKKKYATGKYDCYILNTNTQSKVCPIEDYQEFEKRLDSLFGALYLKKFFILKEHSHIADAAIENPDMEVEYSDVNFGSERISGTIKGSFFLKTYREDLDYRLAKPQNEIKVSSIEDFIKKDSFRTKVYDITSALAEMLIDKNAKYGNSALEPKRIFSKASATEQILVRLDDKLSRLANQNIEDDEDVLVDLMGYLVLLKIAKEK